MGSPDPRSTLVDLRDALTAQLAALTARPEPGSGIGFGKRVGDSTSIAVERITDVAKQETLLVKLHETERALAKLDDGTYGSLGHPLPVSGHRIVDAPEVPVGHCPARSTRRSRRGPA